jgi:transketolase
LDWKNDIADKAADTIRVLSAEAVQKANSGHPGMPMGAADFSLVLWMEYLSFNPKKPDWPNRDRFVLSAGHGSMLLYSLLHLTGYDLSMDDIKNFRQIGSITPGHPEYGETPGVETTSGPLGQGVGVGIGMALAEKIMAAKINTDKYPIIDHNIFGVVGDGDLMEGVAMEAVSIAGHLGLDNLVYLYDDNDITIEGGTGLSISEDTEARFKAVGWNVTKVDGHDKQAVSGAIKKAVASKGKPSLIMAKTVIGKGSPNKAGTSDTHGAPLGEEELALTKDALGWKEKPFTVPADVQGFITSCVAEKQKAYDDWDKMVETFRKDEPEKAKLFDSFVSGDLPDNLEELALNAYDKDKALATRKSSGMVLQEMSKALPTLFGGSADLAPSNNTTIKGEDAVQKGDFSGKNIHFGIREHGMGAVLNGMALYGMIPYGGTFMMFTDYMRPAIRMAALMNQRVIYVMTHDSIFLGEDGPTHQPVEHLSALRAIPNLNVMRPGDSAETALAWYEAIRRTDGPTILSLTRQGLPVLDREKLAPADGLKKGGYVIKKADSPDMIIIATGSELALAIEVAEELDKKGSITSVVSMPCIELFDAQDQAYKDEVLPKSCKKRIVIEAGSSWGWHKYAGDDGLIFSVDTFGTSAPYKDLQKKYGLHKDALLEMIECSFK